MSVRSLGRWRVVILVIIVAAVSLGAFTLTTRAGVVPDVPTVAVTKGEFVDYLQVRGEIRPAKSIVLAAPMQAGELLIVKLAKNGSAVKAGDILVEFDGTALRQRMQEKQSEVKQAEAEIAQMRAQQRITLQQDETGAMRAKYRSRSREARSRQARSGLEARVRAGEADGRRRRAEAARGAAEGHVAEDRGGG